MNHFLIRDMAIIERPRERLAKVGIEALKDEELLALVLQTGYAGHGVMEVARMVLDHYPLPQLITLSWEQLGQLPGIGRSRAAAFLAVIEIVRRNQSPSHSSVPLIQSIADILHQATDIRDKRKEHLLAFFLNARHQLIARDIISIGTLTASLAHPREIFAPAIGKAAAGVILAHNHPSGDPSPSDEDHRLTKRIAQAGHIMGIELLDHVILAERGYYSFREGGQL